MSATSQPSQTNAASSLTQNLFRFSAFLNTISIAGHTKMGFESVYPAVNSISALPQHLIGQRGAQDGWNYMNASLLVAALLNWQWSRTNGPRTTEEKIMLVTLSIAGGISSFRYVQVGAYPPLFCLLVAPTASLIAWCIE